MLLRLDHAALALAVYASRPQLPADSRKTRFRRLTRPCRTGLITRRVPSQGFRPFDHPPYPGLAWRTNISSFSVVARGRVPRAGASGWASSRAVLLEADESRVGLKPRRGHGRARGYTRSASRSLQCPRA